MSVGDQLQSLLTRHCTSLNDEINSIGASLSRAMLVGGAYGERMKATAEMVHKITGSSGSLGFHELSTAARALEDALDELARSATDPGEEDLRALHSHFSQMQKIVEVIEPEDSKLFGVDLDQFAQRAQR